MIELEFEGNIESRTEASYQSSEKSSGHQPEHAKIGA
jgi:hypothetical protein